MGFARLRDTSARGLLALAAGALVALMAACGPRPGLVRLPTGPGVESPDGLAHFDAATRSCRNVDQLSAEVAISGRVAGQRARGRLLVGLARPDGVRVEALAPFGAPIFVLTGQGGEATLLLPRDNRVVSDVPAEAILDALAGLAFSPADLLALVSGCLSARLEADAPMAFGEAWRRVFVPGGDAWVRLEGDRARLVAGRQGEYAIEYTEFVADMPRRLRISTVRGSRAAVDVSLEIRQLDLAPALDARVFEAAAPAGVEPMTLAELRQRGLLGR